MNFFYKVARGLIRMYSRMMLNMDIHWHGEVPIGPKIFIANHPSATDPFVLHLLSHFRRFSVQYFYNRRLESIRAYTYC